MKARKKTKQNKTKKKTQRTRRKEAWSHNCTTWSYYMVSGT